MSTVENTELLEFLKSSIALETDVKTQELLINDLINASERVKPELIKTVIPELPGLPTVYSTSGSFSGVFALIIGGALALASISVGNWASDKGVDGGFWGMLVGIPSIIAIIFGFSLLSDSAKARSLNAQAKEEREKLLKSMMIEQENAKNMNEISTSAYKKNLATWSQTKDNAVKYMLKPLEETRIVLDKLYSKDFIYAKYRNLPALTSIYEYLITGRCSGLTGPHGAYNLYEDEVRKDTVISQLSAVIENLEQIKQTQFMLYQQVRAIQETTRSINHELQQIKHYTINIAAMTELTAYYSALSERNSRVLMYHHLLS